MQSLTFGQRFAARVAPVTSASACRWGTALEVAAHRLAVPVAAAFAAGHCLGTWVHRTSGALGAVASGRRLPAAVAARPAAVPAPAPAVPALASLPVAELRRLAQRRGLRSCGGCRVSKARRDALLQALA